MKTSKTKIRFSITMPKIHKHYYQVCPYCNTEIKNIMCALSGLGNFRSGACKCGNWMSNTNLNYTGENSIYDNKVKFITYTKKT